MKFTPVYNISAKSETECDMLIYGIIGDSWYAEGNPAKRMVTDFKNLEKKYSRINIRINSPGGSVWDGLPMFNAIKSSKADTHTYVDGIAMSMGAMILLAGKTVHAPKGALIMLHNVSGVAIGNAMDLRTSADEMDIYDEVLGQLIADKSGKTLDQVKKDWMNYKDNLMSATTAHAAKLVDVLEDYDAKDVPENIANMSMKEVIDFYKPEETPPAPAPDPANSNPQKDKTMLKKFIEMLTAWKGKKAVENSELTAENIQALNADVKAEGVEGITVMLDTELQALRDNAGKVTDLEAQVTAHKGTIDAHAATIAANKTKIDALEAKVGAAPVDVKSAQALLNDLIQQSAKDDKPEETSVDAEAKKIMADYGVPV